MFDILPPEQVKNNFLAGHDKIREDFNQMTNLKRSLIARIKTHRLNRINEKTDVDKMKVLNVLVDEFNK